MKLQFSAPSVTQIFRFYLVCTKPYGLMQFHGVGDKTITFSGELCRQNDAING